MSEPKNREARDAAVRDLLALLPPSRRAQFVGTLPSEDGRYAVILRSILEDERTRRTRNRTIGIVLAGLSGIVFIVCLSTDPSSLYWLLGGAGLLASLRAIRLHFDASRVEQAVLEVALRTPHKFCLDILLEGMQLVEAPPGLHQGVRHALAQLLQDITPQDTALFTATQREKICRLLQDAVWHVGVVEQSDADLYLAALSALRNIGKQDCLGVIYQLATTVSYLGVTSRIQSAAAECLETLGDRLDFGALTSLSKHVRALYHQFRTEALEPEPYATALMALRRLLPQLTKENYPATLSISDRVALYELLPLALSSPARIQVQEPSLRQTGLLLAEILRTAHRLRDVQALPSLRRCALYERLPAELRALHPALQEARELLEPLAASEQERARMGKTLLRAASAPGLQPDELLRSAAPAESTTDPVELLRAVALPSDQDR